jgi:hypothetical protein
MNIIYTYIDCLQDSGNEKLYILLETIVNPAEVTSTVLIHSHFGPCSVTTSGVMVHVLPTRTRNIMLCSYEPLLQVTKDRMSLSCLNMMIIDVM